MLNKVEGRVARQSGWMVGIAAVDLGRSIAQLYFVTQMFDVAQFGAWSMIVVMTHLLYVGLSVLGHHAATTFMTHSIAVGRPREAAEIMWSIFKVSLLLGLASYGLLIAFALTATGWVGLGDGDATALLVYGTMVVPLSLRETSVAVLRLTDAVAHGFYVTVAGCLAQVLGLLAAWVAGGSTIAVAVVLAGCTTITVGGLHWVAVTSAQRMGLPVKEARKSLPPLPKDVAKFLRGSFWQTKLALGFFQLDMVLAGALTTQTQVGLYSLARRLADVPLTFAHAIAQAVQTECSKRWFCSDGDGFRRLMLRLCAILVGIALTACIGFYCLRKPVFALLDPDYADAADILVILLPAVFASVATWCLIPLATSVGRLKPALIAPAAGVVVLILASVILVPRYGAVGVAWARNAAFVACGVAAVALTIPLWRDSRRLPPPDQPSTD